MKYLSTGIRRCPGEGSGVLNESVPAAEATSVEPSPPPASTARPVGAFERPGDDDPSELICRRWLCRGGIALLAGPTGIGKSSLTMQLAISWTLGRSCFGLKPCGPLRVMIIQGENDDGDVAEMRDGVYAGMKLASVDMAEVNAKLYMVNECERTGLLFLKLLDDELTAHPRDLVFIDPVFSYLGGDASDQALVSGFLRNGLLPILRKHQCGCILVHHTNKPPSGREKPNWKGGDFAYLGSGSAEWANAARAVLAMRSIGSHDKFQLMAGKRGGRLGWTDALGDRIYWKLIGHSPRGICWRELDAGELMSIASAASRKSSRNQLHMNHHGDHGDKPEPKKCVRSPQSVDELVVIFPSELADPPERSFYTARQCRERFAEQGWSRDRSEAMRDTAITEGVVDSFRGPRGTVLYGRASVVAEYLKLHVHNKS